MKKALIFWPYNALGARTGAHQVQLADLMAILHLGYEVTIFASTLYGDPDTAWNIDEMSKLERDGRITIHLAQATLVDRLFHLNQQISHPDTWGMYQTPWLVRDFHNVVLKLNPDLILINYAWWGKLAIDDVCKSATRILRSVDLLEINGQLTNKVSPYLTPPVIPEKVDPVVVEETFYDQVRIDSYEKHSKEIQIYNTYDAVVTITDSDAQVIRTHATCPSVSCVPTGLSVEHVENSYSGSPLFVGSDNPLNIQGYVYFVKKVLPLVRQKAPGFCLQAVGGFSRQVQGVQGVELLGYVPDLLPLYTTSRFTICPMLGGTGSQIKILESMAYGVPVIAMNVVAKASPIEHGVNGLIASNAAEFAEYAIQLYTDANLCRTLGEAARQTITKQFSLEQVVEGWRCAIAAAQTPLVAIAESVSQKLQRPQKVNGHSKSVEASFSQPKISIVTPTKNCARYIRGCIESVLQQDYENVEHIIVDGASADDTVGILKEYPHLKWVSEPDTGEAEALNKALAMATGDIISWLNADDNYFGHDVFRIVAHEMSSSKERHLIYGKTLLTDDQQHISWLQIPRVPITLPILMRWFDLPELYQPSMFYSKELVRSVGKYREDLFFSIDYEYWLRIAAQGYSFQYIDHVLSQSRLFRKSGKSALPKKEQEESWTQTAMAFQNHLSEVERIHFWKDYYRYQLPYLKQSDEPITPPNDNCAQIGLALVLRSCGVNAEVVKLLEHTTTISPQCSDAHWLLGDELFRGTKDYSRAKSIFEQAKALTYRKQKESVQIQPSSELNSKHSRETVDCAMTLHGRTTIAHNLCVNEQTPTSLLDRSLRVLFQIRPNASSHPGGDTLVMYRLKAGLQKLGIHVDVELGKTAVEGYDLIHLFNFATPEFTEQCAREAAQVGIPFVVTTLFEDWEKFLSKCFASVELFKDYFCNGFNEEKFVTHLNYIRCLPPAVSTKNHFAAQHAECLFATGEVERRRLREVYPTSKHIEVVKLGMDHLRSDISSALFCEQYQVKDYVLCVGRLEPRKNQLMLLKALQHEAMPIVCVTAGVSYQADYEDLCRRFPRKAKMLFIDRLSDDMLASCYRGAKVFCLPSWYELPGIVTIEAARFGCAVVATSWGTIKDYLPYGVHYCEPDDPKSIREAVLDAYHAAPPPQLQRDALGCTWDRSVGQLLEQYDRILSGTKSEISQGSVYSPKGKPDQTISLDDLKDAQVALTEGRLDEAQELLDQYIHQDPAHAEAWLLYGLLCIQQKNYQQSIDVFGTALGYGTNDRRCRMGMVMAFMGQASERQAQQVLLEVLEMHPDDEEAIHWLIRTSTILEDWEELERSLEHFLQRNPANHSVRFALASVQVKLLKVNEAQSHLDTLRGLDLDFEGLEDLQQALGCADIHSTFNECHFRSA